ncbi:hypothetical protein G3M48_007977 [Beauveria asiatica]|uniref:RING-type domain-containing protein n=1 Tax=Beauveria asiatica TaxID=1069075 RepID=A0AAW0RL67_9HYPO
MPFDRRLDAATREVVFCHTCSSEWYGIEWGLMCPACSGEITEIVTLENDPRPAREDDSDDPGYSSSSSSEYEEVYVYVPSSQRYTNVHREDEYASGPHYHEHVDRNGFGHNHSTRIGQDANHYHAYPGQSVERFLNIASDLGMPVGGNMRHHLHEASQNGRGHHEWDDGTSRGFVTFLHSDGRSATGGHVPPGSDPFQSIFNSVFHGYEGQLLGEAASAAARQGRGADPNLARNVSGVHGDAVADESLDQIISTLTPHVPVRPLTSQQALANLSRKTISEGSTDGDTDCSICMDGLKAGQVAVTLPCKHLFHEKCGLEWLKDHDTCPSLVDRQSKTERGWKENMDQIAFRCQEVVWMIDEIHSELDDHQTMDIQHQDPHDHQIRATA